MSEGPSKHEPVDTEMSDLTAAQWREVTRSQAARIQSLEHRIAWFERQFFGSKSERLSLIENPAQLSLSEAPGESQKAATARTLDRQRLYRALCFR